MQIRFVSNLIKTITVYIKKYQFIFSHPLSILLLVVLVGCRTNNESGISLSEEVEFPDQEGWNSTMISTSNGTVNAIIHYGHMARFSRQKTVNFDGGIQVDFFNQEGQHTSRLTSERGVLNESTNDVEAIGNVVVVSDSGITLRTEKLKWLEAEAKIISDDFVTITTLESDTLYGIGFESDRTMTNWEIKQPWGVTEKKLDFKLKGNIKKREKESVPPDSLVRKNEASGDSTAVRDSADQKLEYVGESLK